MLVADEGTSENGEQTNQIAHNAKVNTAVQMQYDFTIRIITIVIHVFTKYKIINVWSFMRFTYVNKP